MLILCGIQIVMAIMAIKNPNQWIEWYGFGFTEGVRNFAKEEWLEIQRLLGELEETEKREQRQKRIEGRKNGKDRKKR